MLLPKRIWKDIKGYEGYYQVANIPYADKRQVRSVDHWITTKDGRKVLYKGRLLKYGINKGGYLCVVLSVNRRKKTKTIHRLVAGAFLENPNNYKEVNHKDENKSNNLWTNLEYCTSKYNVNYGTRNERASKSLKGRKVPEEQRKRQSLKMMGKMTGEKNPTSKPIRCIETGDEFKCKRQAKKWLGKGDIGYALRTGGTAGGYHWEYIE